MTVVNSTAIAVQWRNIDCLHWNGLITHYSVRYWKLADARTIEEENISVPPGSHRAVTETIVIDLAIMTTYAFQVAAENSAGSGIYSDPINITTPDSEWHHW